MLARFSSFCSIVQPQTRRNLRLGAGRYHQPFRNTSTTRTTRAGGWIRVDRFQAGGVNPDPSPSGSLLRLHPYKRIVNIRLHLRSPRSSDKYCALLTQSPRHSMAAIAVLTASPLSSRIIPSKTAASPRVLQAEIISIGTQYSARLRLRYVLKHHG